MPFIGHAWIIAVLVLAIVLIVLGPGKLSQLGGALGKSIKDFRKERDAQESADEAKNKQS